MCLYTNQTEPLIAKKDIIVYKDLEFDYNNDCKVSPFRYMKYEFGKLYKSGLKSKPVTRFGSDRNIEVTIGLHSHLEEGITNKQPWGKFYKAIVPKGARYYIDELEYLCVSDKLIVTDETL